MINNLIQKIILFKKLKQSKINLTIGGLANGITWEDIMIALLY